MQTQMQCIPLVIAKKKKKKVVSFMFALLHQTETNQKNNENTLSILTKPTCFESGS